MSSRVSRTFSAFIVVIVFLITACGGQNEASLEGQEGSTDLAAVTLTGVPAPSTIHENLSRQTSSTRRLELPGNDFLLGNVQHVTTTGCVATFTPECAEGTNALGDSAYAIYHFNLLEYSGTRALQLNWDEAPQDFSQLWIGLSEWDTDCWTWQLCPENSILDLETLDPSRFINDESGDMFVALILQGSQPAQLYTLQAGESVDEPIIITRPPGDVCSHYEDCIDYLSVDFIGTEDNTLSIAWDFGGGAIGVKVNGREIAARMLAVGEYNCSITVSNAYGDPAVYPFTLEVMESQRGDWYMFGREPYKRNCSPYNGPATDNIRWTFDTGDSIGSSPALAADGTIYFGGGTVSDKFYAINHDGSLKWDYSIGDRSGSPAVDADGTVYVGAVNGVFYAFSPAGALEWSYTTGDRITASAMIGPDRTVYIGSADGKFYAFTPDGVLKWTVSTGDKIWFAPAISDDMTIYLASNDNNVYALNPNGTVKWTFSTLKKTRYISLGDDGTIYACSDTRYLYSLDQSGTKLWDLLCPSSVNVSCAINTNGNVYYCCSQRLYAITSIGAPLWQFTTGVSDTMNSSPAIGADGTIYFGSGNTVYAVDTNGDLVWSYETGSNASSSPAIGEDGTLYIGSSDGKLYAFGTSL